MTNKISALFALLMGIGYFCLFAYDIEYDRDLMTWVWLLFSQIWFMISLSFWILDFWILDDKIKPSPVAEVDSIEIFEKDLDIYDVWEAPSGNCFIKISNDYSIAIGPKGSHEPNEVWGDLKRTQYVKSNNITPVKKIGNIIFK
jgi:hypothetical protein